MYIKKRWFAAVLGALKSADKDTGRQYAVIKSEGLLTVGGGHWYASVPVMDSVGVLEEYDVDDITTAIAIAKATKMANTSNIKPTDDRKYGSPTALQVRECEAGYLKDSPTKSMKVDPAYLAEAAKIIGAGSDKLEIQIHDDIIYLVGENGDEEGAKVLVMKMRS